MNTKLEIINGKSKFQDPSIAPMHTLEHILNQTMVRMFGCGRSFSAHIEQHKSKCDYHLNGCPNEERIKLVEQQVNRVIASNLPVTIEYVDRGVAGSFVDLSKLPDDSGERLRIVRIGDYDACACCGLHVDNTSMIEGRFRIISYSFSDGVLRIRFRLEK